MELKQAPGSSCCPGCSTLPSIFFLLSLKKALKLISQHLQIHNWSCGADRPKFNRTCIIWYMQIESGDVTGYLRISKLIQLSESGRWFCHCNGTRGIWESGKFEMLPCAGWCPNQPLREQRVAAVTSTTQADGVLIIRERSAGNSRWFCRAQPVWLAVTQCLLWYSWQNELGWKKTLKIWVHLRTN